MARKAMKDQKQAANTFVLPSFKKVLVVYKKSFKKKEKNAMHIKQCIEFAVFQLCMLLNFHIDFKQRAH